MDIGGHIITKHHTRFSPIENCFPSEKNKNILSLPNISFSRKWNKKVKKIHIILIIIKRILGDQRLPTLHDNPIGHGKQCAKCAIQICKT